MMKILSAVSILLDESVLGKPFLVVVLPRKHWSGTQLVYGRPAFPWTGSGDTSAQATKMSLRPWTMLPSVCQGGQACRGLSTLPSFLFKDKIHFCLCHPLQSHQISEAEPDLCNKLPEKREKDKVTCLEIWFSSWCIQGYLFQKGRVALRCVLGSLQANVRRKSSVGSFKSSFINFSY